MFNITPTQLRKAIQDLGGGFLLYRLWHLLAWQEIKSRYRRSTLGPLWLTISMGIQIVTMGVIIAYLFNQSFGKFLPYVCAGLILWSFINGVVTDGAMSFVASNSQILQISRPLSTYIFQTIWRNLIVGAHNMVVFVIVAAIYSVLPNANTLYLLISLPVLIINLGWLALALGVLSTRFRDIPTIVTSILTLLFWLIPIVYYPEQLGTKRIIADVNPLTHLVEIVRAPLLGLAPSLTDWAFAIGTAVVGWGLTLLFFARFRARVPYWL